MINLVKSCGENMKMFQAMIWWKQAQPKKHFGICCQNMDWQVLIMNTDKVVKELIAFAQENTFDDYNSFKAGIQFAVGYAVGIIMKNESENSQET